MIRKNLFVSILVSSLMLGANLSGVSADKVSKGTVQKSVLATTGVYGVGSSLVSLVKRFVLDENSEKFLSDEGFVGKYVGEKYDSKGAKFWVPVVGKLVLGVSSILAYVC